MVPALAAVSVTLRPPRNASGSASSAERSTNVRLLADEEPDEEWEFIRATERGWKKSKPSKPSPCTGALQSLDEVSHTSSTSASVPSVYTGGLSASFVRSAAGLRVSVRRLTPVTPEQP